VNPATLSALAALAGSAIGGLASFTTTWLTQHYQSRIQRQSQENARRERLFSDFIIQASKLYADAMTHDLVDVSTLVPLYALKAQLGLFASKATIERADGVLRLIMEIYHSPNTDFRDPKAAQTRNIDILQAFTEACRAELR
jgi:hypothetical protein